MFHTVGHQCAQLHPMGHHGARNPFPNTLQHVFCEEEPCNHMQAIYPSLANRSWSPESEPSDENAQKLQIKLQPRLEAISPTIPNRASCQSRAVDATQPAHGFIYLQAWLQGSITHNLDCDLGGLQDRIRHDQLTDQLYTPSVHTNSQLGSHADRGSLGIH